MTIYEARGFQSNLVYPFDKMEPFQYIERFKPLVVPEGANIEEFKRIQAPYCISGKVTPEKNGSYKRNNTSLIYRDLIFLDYDDIQGTTEDFIEAVSSALFGYSYILYPTIKQGLYLELAALESGIIKKQELSNTRVQTSRVNTTENNLINVLKLKEYTLQRIERLTEEIMEISRLIDKLANPLERSVLRLFYLNVLDAWQVAEEIDKSKTAVYIIRQKAIEHLANVG